MRSKTLRFASQARSPAGFGREIEPILAVLTPRTPFTVNRRTVAGQAGPTPLSYRSGALRRKSAHTQPPDGYAAFGFTALAKFAKKSSAIFLAAPLTRR